MPSAQCLGSKTMQNQVKDNFEKDGFVFPVEVFSVEEAAGLLKR